MNPVCIHNNHTITGRYYRDYWGNSVCAAHYRQTPACPYCGRFISKESTGGGKTLSDGQAICALCDKAAVKDVAEGKTILMETYTGLEKMGIVIKPFKPGFALIDRLDLKRLDRTGREKQGTARFRRSLFNGKIRQFDLQIFLLNGLPRVSFISTCAHELMHIWFYSRGITDASPALVEGSCNLAAWLILRTRKEPEAAYLMQGFFKDRHKDYGRGFRKMHKLASSRGIPYWLEYIGSRKK